MKFRNGKSTSYVVLRLVEGDWEYWDHAATEAEAMKMWTASYNDDWSNGGTFAIARQETFKLPNPKPKKRKT